MTRSYRRSEEGSALLLVLALLTILSLALGALFANEGANLTMSSVVTNQNNKVYAADGGVEYAIQQLRTTSSLCKAHVSLLSTTINGRSVNVTCDPTAGQATSVSPWALVTTDPRGNNSLSTPNNGETQAIDGPVYVSGATDLDEPLTVNGAFLQTTACPGPIDNLTVTSPKVLACSTTMQPPDPAPSLPPIPTIQQSGSPAYVYKGCSIWTPGVYKKQTLKLGPDNYFASGIYYFDDTPIVLDGVKAKSLIGGRPGPDDQQAAVLPSTVTGPCASVTDKTAGRANGSGVEFILGGSSTISVSDPSDPVSGPSGGAAELELFARVPATSSEGTAGISIRTVPTPRPSTSWDEPDGNPVVLSAAGVNPRIAIHGYVYVPQGSVNIDADWNVPLTGGLYCWQATLSSSGTPPVQISPQSGAQPRYVTITATAMGDSGQTDVVSTAVVSIGNDAARTVDIQSWVTGNPADLTVPSTSVVPGT